MTEPPDAPKPEDEEPGARLPGLRSAVFMTALGWSSAVLISGVFAGWASPTVAIAIGIAVGFGGVGTLAARLIPDAEARLGLQAFPTRMLPALVLLMPAVILASEVDNIAAQLLPRGEEDPAEPTKPGLLPFVLLETVITVVLLRPVVEEFFFRGVVQYRLGERFGPAWSILGGALLFAVARACFALPGGAPIVATLFGQALFLGAIFGSVRHMTGSLLAAIVCHVGIRASGFIAVAYAAQVPIEGFNVPGAHTPFWILAACTLAVVTGLVLLSRGRETPGD